MRRLLIFLAAVVGHSLKAQNNTLPSYNDFVAGIIQNNPLAKRAGNEKLQGELLLRAAKGNYDPSITGDVNQKQFNGTHYYTMLTGEIRQPLFTSQYLRAGYEFGSGPYLNPERYTPAQGLPYVGVELGILQGLVIDERRAGVLKARSYQGYYNAEQRIQLNDLLFESSQRYFDWLFSARQIALNIAFMETAYRRLQGIGALADAGERAAVDTVEAAILLQGRLLDMQNARIENQKNLNELAALIWQNSSPVPVTGNFQTADSLDDYYEKAKAVLAEQLNKLEIQNPVLSKYEANKKILGVDVRLKKEMIKPVLNLKYNFLGNGDLTYNGFASSNSYKWGINLSFPLFLRNSVNEYKLAKVQLQNNDLEYVSKRNELALKMNALRQSVSLIASQLTNAERSVNYGRALLEAEQIKFDNGESSLFMLNTRETRLLESELKLAEYKLKFIKMVLQIVYLNGDLSYRL